jgi:DNA-binding HxlR family transcriptional regulator
VKKYGQHCPLARALDVIGERWSPLIVRELSLGPRRYSDLLHGLPGIPTNLLATRLRDLQDAAVVSKRTLPPPAAATVYELTEAGRALRPALSELRAWGRRYGPAPSEEDTARPGWALLSATGRPVALPDGTSCELRVDEEFFHLGVAGGALSVRGGPADRPDAVVTIPAGALYTLMYGEETREATVLGDDAVAREVLGSLRGVL